MKHILLQNAFSFARRRVIDDPHGFVYNKQIGAWLEKNNGQPLVFHPDYPKTGTKKLDAETGEDHKGQ